MAKMKRELRIINKDILNSTQVQANSTKLLDFYVNDMLSLAQINSDKFRKDISHINVRETIEKVMDIQMYKAQTIGINLTAEFIGFEERQSYLVSTDEQRL